MRIRHIARGAVIAASTMAAVLAGGTAAFAQYPGGGTTPPNVGGGEFFPPGAMPGTGSDVLLFIVIAILALVAGLGIRTLSRRTARSDD